MVHRYTCTLCMYVCMYVCMYDIHTWTVLMPHLGQKHGLLARPLGNWGECVRFFLTEFFLEPIIVIAGHWPYSMHFYKIATTQIFVLCFSGYLFIFRLYNKMTMEVILSTAFGRSVDVQGGNGGELFEAAANVMNSLTPSSSKKSMQNRIFQMLSFFQSKFPLCLRSCICIMAL